MTDTPANADYQFGHRNGWEEAKDHYRDTITRLAAENERLRQGLSDIKGIAKGRRDPTMNTIHNCALRALALVPVDMPVEGEEPGQ